MEWVGEVELVMRLADLSIIRSIQNGSETGFLEKRVSRLAVFLSAEFMLNTVQGLFVLDDDDVDRGRLNLCENVYGVADGNSISRLISFMKLSKDMGWPDHMPVIKIFTIHPIQ
ncbi:hypothetical protein IEQ34_002384 [Dendrobium chrysotoxum]|uniref:Uncharacterized protein n=1 Tax=Dendrobium chrysotoxum TaxID=161865 RepID=A0AAV7HJQ6_DENCH|nr:hypothetical protein IEQ34_002384 [Dendrobium chrysotoxum]